MNVDVYFGLVDRVDRSSLETAKGESASSISCLTPNFSDLLLECLELLPTFLGKLISHESTITFEILNTLQLLLVFLASKGQNEDIRKAYVEPMLKNTMMRMTTQFTNFEGISSDFSQKSCKILQRTAKHVI